MRAKEFISEDASKGLRGKTRAAASKEFSAAHPSVIAPDGRGDMYIGRYYDFYRIAQLTGMHPDDLDELDEVSFFGNLPAYSGYSEADREKLFRVMKKLGMKPTDYIPTGSTEVEGTNTKSPINKFKGYKK